MQRLDSENKIFYTKNGIIYFQDDKTDKKIIVFVKSGEHVTRPHISDLKNTVEREKAQLALDGGENL